MPDSPIRTQWVLFIAIAAWLLSDAAGAGQPAQLAALVSRHFDTAFLTRSAEYHRVNLYLFLIQTLVLLTAVFLLVRGPLGVWSRRALELGDGRLWLARALLLGMAYSSITILRLPFSVIRYFHALAYGLRNDTLGIYLLDWFKGILITGSLVIVVGLIILELFARFPRGWIAMATSAIGLLAVVYTLFGPLLIEPLFYEFYPLENPVLRERLLNLTECAGLEVENILVADASRHSETVNAYVTGIGATARIVLFDTLLNKFNPDEISIVLAHEIGHRTHAHIPKGLFLGLAALVPALWFADAVLNRCARGRLRGIVSQEDPALAIPAYALYIILMYGALVPSNILSRQMEAEADRTALELTGDPDTLIQSQIRIAKANLSEVLPAAWVEFAFYTHPSIARRILIAETYRDRRDRTLRPCAERRLGN